MRIIRSLVIVAGFLLIALSSGVIVFAGPIEQFVKHRIETRLSYIFKSDVRLGALEIAPLQRGAVVRGLTVRNPAGFRQEPAIHLRHLTFSFELASLFSPLLVLDTVRLQEMDVFLRHEAGRGANLIVLAHNARSAEQSDAGSDKPGRRVLIRELTSAGGEVRLSTNLLPVGQLPMRLTSFTLENIGSDKPVSAAGMAAVFMRSLVLEIVTLKGTLRPLASELAEELDRIFVP